MLHTAAHLQRNLGHLRNQGSASIFNFNVPWFTHIRSLGCQKGFPSGVVLALRRSREV